MPRWGLCTTHPRDSIVLPLSQPDVQSSQMAQEGSGLSSSGSSFLIPGPCNVWAPMTLCHRLFSHSCAAEKSDPFQLWGTWYSCHIQLFLTWWHVHCLSPWWVLCLLLQHSQSVDRVGEVSVNLLLPSDAQTLCWRVFYAKIAWGKFAVHWPQPWMQRKLCTFEAHACFQPVKIHCPIKIRPFSAVFSPVWHISADANRSSTGTTGTQNAWGGLSSRK